MGSCKMTDVMSAEQRSAAMSKIRGKDTKPELLVRHSLWRLGFRFRLHVKGLPGRPDIVLPKWRALVFVHGCFWHRHEGCPLFRLPSTRQDFWDSKLRQNQARDLLAVRSLLSCEWRVAVVWECAMRTDTVGTISQLAHWIESRAVEIELPLADGTAKID